MRHAVEDHLGPAPKVDDPNDDRHPFNRGLIFSDIGNLMVYMFVDDPGRFYLDIHGQQPATDAQAKVAFGIEAFNRYRAQAVELDDDRRIEAAIAEQQEPDAELQAKVDLKAKVRRLVREQQKKVQAEADRQRTSWLDNEAPMPASTTLAD
jgi:hypothetical protein